MLQMDEPWWIQNLDERIDNIKHVLLCVQTSNVDELKIIRGASSDHFNKGTS